ncbi:hypothetical protein [Streptomyces sp. CA2R106]|uniref:hypothetical protein n=1 Tax=Streptomyces sp. CA2R106 TaxID=3120153 RepID=UPI00300B0753
MAAAADRPADRGFAFGAAAFGFGPALVRCPAFGLGFASGFAFGAAFGFGPAFSFGAAFGFGVGFGFGVVPGAGDGFGFAPGAGAARPVRNSGTRSATAPGLLA